MSHGPRKLMQIITKLLFPLDIFMLPTQVTILPTLMFSSENRLVDYHEDSFARG